MHAQTTNLVTLSTQVRLIPMVNNWYTTPLLISPLTFGLVTKRSHLPLLASYIDAPEVHQQCVSTPELRGGPFVDYGGDPAVVADFAASTRQRCAAALHSADAIESIYSQLLHKASGASIGALYHQVDASLKDCVEFHYDLYKQPGVRFVESTVYRKAATHTALQSCRLEPVSKSERPFFLSTPLLARHADAVDIQAPFGDPVWDTLFARTPMPAAALLDALTPYLEDQEGDRAKLARLLAPAPAQAEAQAAARQPVAPGTTRVRYFGHACVLVESAHASVLIDPLVSYPGESDVERFTFDDLPAHIDYILITHAHVDHFVLETLLQLRHKVRCVVVGRAGGGSLQDISLKLALQHCGFKNVVELSEHEEIVFDGGRIVGAPFYGEHADLDIRAKLAFGVTLDQATCAFFADSNPPHPECYASMKAMLPAIDCLFIGMECVGAPASWSYGPLLQRALARDEDQSRRLDGSNADTASAMQAFLDPARMFVYAMGAEPWVTHLSSIVYSEQLPQFQQARQFERMAAASGRHAEVLFGAMELSL
jgi:L-ascorbate metabolism protein UlaG (beta-lactamase superfamily)